MTEPLIVTITVTSGNTKMLQLVHPATENSMYEIDPGRGIDLGDGRVWYGYAFKPFVAPLPEEPTP